MSFLAERRKRRTSSSLELAPLLDVLFLLIIFFSVSSTFIKESRFDIELPETGEVAEMSVSETSVSIYGDKKVNYQSIVSVMDICRESGIKSISIVAIED